MDVLYGSSFATLMGVVDEYRAADWGCARGQAIRSGSGLAIGETWTCTKCR